MMQKGRLTSLLFLMAVTFALSLSITSCRRDDPVREIWARAVRGEYSQIKETFLANAAPDLSKQSAVGYNLAATCVEALTARADNDAVRTLTELLEAGFPGSFRIARTIACSGNNVAIDKMFQLTKSQNRHIREGIAMAISSRGCLKDDPRSVETLRKLAEDSSSDVRRNALSSLGFLATGPSIGVVRPVIEAALDDPDASPRAAALDVFASMYGVDAQSAIRDGVKDRSQRVREVACGWLHLLPEEEAVEHFRHLSESKDENTRQLAVGVTKLESEEATQIVTRLSEDQSEEVRWRLAYSLRNPFPGREQVLLRLSKDPSPEVRGWSSYSLITINTDEARGALRRLLRDQSDRVVSCAIDAVSRGSDEAWRPELIAAVSRLARSGSDVGRISAISRIDGSSLHELEDLLVKMTDDRMLWVRRDAFRALYKLNPDRLRKVLGDH